MPKFGNPMGRVPRAKSKGVGQVMLPNRAAVHKLTGGKQGMAGLGGASINDYAAATPSGANAPQSYPAIMQEGDEGVNV